MAAGRPPRTGAFISYSHKDKVYLEQLRVNLKAAMRQQPLEVWDDTMIQPGDHWREQIKRALVKARVAVLLVSPDFLASDFITENELPSLLAAAEREGLVVLPVIVCPSLFEESPLGGYQAINLPNEPLSGMPEVDRDRVWVRLARRIREVLGSPLLVGTTLLTYTGHTGAVGNIAWSPDGKRLASGSGDKTIQVWDAATGQRLLTYSGHSNDIRVLAWSPDGQRLASGDAWSSSSQPTVQVWDAQNGQKFFSSALHAFCITWALHYRMFAVAASAGEIHLLDAATGQRIALYRGKREENVEEYWRRLAWSSDGRFITGIRTFSSKGWPQPQIDVRQIEVWRFPTLPSKNQGELVCSYLGHQEKVGSAMLSPDGTRAVSASQDGSILVWDAKKAKLLLVCRSPGWTGSLAWSPDGKYFAAAKPDNSIEVWDAERGVLRYAYTGHTGWVYGVVWSPDGKRIASGSTDETVQVWVAP